MDHSSPDDAARRPEVASREYFELFDTLDHEASMLGQARRDLHTATDELRKLRQDLKLVETEVTHNRSFAKEQEDRIKLVSSHWFFGTTALQPQLWLRGGCKGKIQRAEAKLEKAENEYPTLVATVQQIKENRLPPLELAVEQCTIRRDRAFEASTTRDLMKESAVSQYPSPRLLELEQQTFELQDTIQALKADERELTELLLRLGHVESDFEAAVKSARQAEGQCREFDSLSAKPLPSPPKPNLSKTQYSSRSEKTIEGGKKLIEIRNRKGVNDVIVVGRNGRVELTNFPCPNNCGYLITWHASHCCNACQQGRPHQHGRNCNRKPIESQQGAREKLREHQRRVEHHHKKIQQSKSAFRDSIRQTERLLKSGGVKARSFLNDMPRSVQEVCPRVGDQDRFQAAYLPAEDAMVGTFSSALEVPARALQSIQRLESAGETLCSWASSLREDLNDRKSVVCAETQELIFKQRQVEDAISAEKDSIFSSLRDQANTSAPPPAYNPGSTVEEEGIDAAIPSAPLEASVRDDPDVVIASAIPVLTEHIDADGESIPFAKAERLEPDGLVHSKE